MLGRDPRSHDVAVIGCGLLGSAVARRLESDGYSVAAWNRTPARAEALAGDRISPMRSAADAIRSSRLALAFTTSYETTVDSLEQVDDWTGTALIDFASGTPRDAEMMGDWAATRGADYLDGVLLSYPKEVGLPGSVAAFSGPPEIWRRHRQLLMSLGGGSFHASERVGVANVLFVGLAGFCIAAMGAYGEAVSYIRSHGVAAEQIQAMTSQAITLIRDDVGTAAMSIEEEAYDTDQAVIATYADAMRSFLMAMRTSDQRARIFEATKENLEAAEAAGMSERGFYAQTTLFGVS